MSKAGVTLSLADIQAKLGGQLVGDGSVQIEAIAPLAEATAGQISFLSQRKYAPLLATTQATALILPLEAAGHFPRPHVLTENPYLYFARVSQLLNPVTIPDPRIHPTAVISPTAKIGRNAVIHAGVVIGDEVTIGDDALIYPNVTIYHDCHIGDRVVIHAGVVIGADGFGNAKDGDVWIKIPQIGRVIMGDDVEVGANTCIDRGALDDTVIGNGVKIDDQIMIGHNCRIGNNTAIAACAGIAGSTIIGERCLVGGAAMFSGHIEITDDVQISGGSAIIKNIKKPGQYTGVFPSVPHADWLHIAANLRQLDGLSKKIQLLEAQIQALAQQKNGE
ncbi:UDP-3-O-(3-hydroxymyristoyl)glucosamine N-acyltransferase [Fluviibacter phosphoraccumulans]|uniref:UDP-3-O-acylglucosamine N-acyltransferase n=1 Tax=Fluviibacter phosphoraccumulans TaxID=1751046 RepID=A0A679HVE9_9RHOO|nr:UDP-3-O-(3-hydroxymyristoyl)glucosamine N-acyltransferase [Fluviibacter phosphoraccumulans]BBU69582.1 UDP-3-O-acylglucosamine N-acyltransferase [Fluviibacter phosphoraccumulans]BBU71235.1 UDP-3-O-acylglucosamine N-acyltransferase [Fluviibacter phosphoraccumulans]BCA65521.1 UDP-3-O-acylglucosamine N-acyltransferase [Fluviibacter phosphoraccumulans]